MGQGNQRCWKQFGWSVIAFTEDVAEAAKTRNNGFAMLRQGANASEGISIMLETNSVQYELCLGFSRGQMEQHAGEVLYSKELVTSLDNSRHRQ